MPGFAGDRTVTEPPVALVGGLGADAEGSADLGTVTAVAIAVCRSVCRAAMRAVRVSMRGSGERRVMGLSTQVVWQAINVG